jgi:class 3 adenylate cyclase
MAPLDQKTRDRLPDSAFAYIDSRGGRRLPIHDESHVRTALSRFNQTRFEDDAARERARTRLLKAAKKYGILPVGFVTSQIRSQSQEAARLALENERMQGEIEARSGDVRTLPTGLVTFLLADIEDSTGLVRRLGDRYPGFLDDAHQLLRAAVRASGGREVDARADELFAAFAESAAALEAAVAIQRSAASHSWPDEIAVRFRIGLHCGRPTLTDSGYVGLAVHAAARVGFSGHGGQVVLSGEAREALGDVLPAGLAFRNLGFHQLQGLPEPTALFQLEIAGLPVDFPPLRATVAVSS